MGGLKTATPQSASSMDNDSPMVAQMECPTQSSLPMYISSPSWRSSAIRADLLHTPGLEEQLDTPLRVSLPSLLLLR